MIRGRTRYTEKNEPLFDSPLIKERRLAHAASKEFCRGCGLSLGLALSVQEGYGDRHFCDICAPTDEDARNLGPRQVECDECDGEGQVECLHCGQYSDCKVCDGEGTVSAW